MDKQNLIVEGALNSYEQNYGVLAAALRFFAKAVVVAALLLAIAVVAAAEIVSGGLA